MSDLGNHPKLANERPQEIKKIEDIFIIYFYLFLLVL